MIYYSVVISIRDFYPKKAAMFKLFDFSNRRRTACECVRIPSPWAWTSFTPLSSSTMLSPEAESPKLGSEIPNSKHHSVVIRRQKSKIPRWPHLRQTKIHCPGKIQSRLLHDMYPTPRAWLFLNKYGQRELFRVSWLWVCWIRLLSSLLLLDSHFSVSSVSRN